MTIAGHQISPPASAENLALLKQVLPREMPQDYFAFMQGADGREVWFDGDDTADVDCIRIYSVSEMLDLQTSLQSLLPSLIVIGGDQGGQQLGYDATASAPWPIVMYLPGWGE
jgi:hypothetical protein